MSENLETVTIEILRDVQAKILQSRTETLARLDNLEATIPRDQNQAVAAVATMRTSVAEIDVCLKDIDNLIAGLDNEAH
ncbi:hypothetical protein [Methylobacterium brachiatum]|jgi:hypothetical protein|uniref:hypothetical protein n=1 Tax=Methylobacterium brachiatum TaxID=269660 RepID=UPI0008E5BE19|nr:hypothetical protein [Methylobacterium brachiatum]SFI25283.1 hypothetical protein SAMN02799642_01246 [Methylobacterium brachiatum]